MNKSQIFKTAHSLVRKYGVSLSVALKMAWGKSYSFYSIYDYTKDGFWTINSNCNAGKVNSQIQKLSAELAVLPNFSGKVYRGIEVESTTDFHNEIKGKKSVTFKAFVSTSKNAKRAFCGNVQFVIVCKTGKDISALSAKAIEEEVLFNRNSAFNVQKVELKNGKVLVSLTEK
jgi:hypothetical protein